MENIPPTQNIPPTPRRWSNWQSLGGGLTSIPSVASNEDGRLEVFVIGLDKKLYHIWQNAPNGQWNTWQSLGGSPNTWPGPAVARNADGRLEVFSVRTDQTLYHIWQNAPNGQWVNNWQSLGGIQIDGGPSAALQWSNGIINLFVRGVDHNLYHTFQNSPNGQWGSWYWRVKNINHNEPQSVTPVTFWYHDRRLVGLAVFIVASGGNNWYQQQEVDANGGVWWPAPGQWRIVGNSPMNSVPAAARNADGRLEVFVTAWQGGSPNSGELYHTWQL